jgi:hypothetical protein
MKQQHETTIQFSGYPLSIAETQRTIKKADLIVIKPFVTSENSFPKKSIANDPNNWDVDWFNSYE